jgi:hypothetical protein
MFSALFSERWEGDRAIFDANGRRMIAYENIEPAAMLVLLEWVDTGRISVTDDLDLLYAVLEAAEFLGITSLLDEAFKKNSRESSDVKTLLVFADKHNPSLVYPLYHKLSEVWFMKDSSFLSRSLIVKMIFMEIFDIEKVEPIFVQIEEAAYLTKFLPLVQRCLNSKNRIDWNQTAKKATFLIVVF